VITWTKFPSCIRTSLNGLYVGLVKSTSNVWYLSCDGLGIWTVLTGKTDGERKVEAFALVRDALKAALAMTTDLSDSEEIDGIPEEV